MLKNYPQFFYINKLSFIDNQGSWYLGTYVVASHNKLNPYGWLYNKWDMKNKTDRK